MSNLSLDSENLKSFVSDQEVHDLQPQVNLCHDGLEGGTGKGSDYLGWSRLPSGFSDSVATEITSTAGSIRSLCDAFIVVGIGGSYLGSRAGISYLSSSFSNQFGRQAGFTRVGPGLSTLWMVALA